MITSQNFFNGYTIVIPPLVGAFLAGIFYLSEGSAIPVTLFQMGLILSITLFSMKVFVEQEAIIELYGLEKWYLLFFTLIALSIIYTPEKPQALFYFIRILVLVLMTYIIYNSVNSEKELLAISIVLVLVAVIVGSIGIVKSYLNPESLILNFVNQGKTLIRDSGVEEDPNIYASNFFTPLMLSISLFLSDIAKKIKLALFFCVIIFIITILLTYSRSAWVSVFFGVVIIIFLTKKFNFIMYGAVVLTIVFASSETMQNFSISLLNRLIDIFAGTQDDSSNIRIILAKASVLMLLDSYLIGVGFQGYSTAFLKYHTSQETLGVIEPHNEFYTIYAELGVLGILIFTTLIFLIYKRAKENTMLEFENNKLRLISIALYAAFICYVIFYQFYGGMLYNSILMILIGLIFGLNKVGLNNKKVIHQIKAS